MISVKCFYNEIFTSNTYLIHQDDSKDDCWLIDAGFDPLYIDSYLKGYNISGVFLTHAHYDHIFGLNHVVDLFPKSKIYCTDFTRDSLRNPKLNLSFYHDMPIYYERENIITLEDGEEVNLDNNLYLKAIATPGHNAGSLSYIVEEYFFTGDSFIPGIPVVTKLKGGNKHENEISLIKIKEIIDSQTILCPGHGPMFMDKEIIIF